jgi:hypothetical protein
VYLKYDAVQFHCLWQYMNEPVGFVALRDRMIDALVPAPLIRNAIDKLLQQHPNLVAVHARTETDWLEYCPSEKLRMKDCFISTRMIAKILLTQLTPKSTVYVLSGSEPSVILLTKLLEPHQITVISKKNWGNIFGGAFSVGFEDLTEYMAFMDQRVALNAPTFYAQYSSSFSRSIFDTRASHKKKSYKLNDYLEDGYYPFDEHNRYIPQFEGDENV